MALPSPSPTQHVPVLEDKPENAHIDDTVKGSRLKSADTESPTMRGSEEAVTPTSTAVVSPVVGTGEGGGKEQPIVALSRSRFFAVFISQLVSIFRGYMRAHFVRTA